MNVPIQEDFKLPSLGKVYNKPFDPRVKLRSMTVVDEMKRLNPTTTPYRTMSEIIEDCLLTKLPISVYDLCLGDYVYLLNKLRIVTYGNQYKYTAICPVCGNQDQGIFNLDDLIINEYTDDIEELKTVTLSSGKVAHLKFQTPRDLDNISNKVSEYKKNYPDSQADPTVLYTLMSFIDYIDGVSPTLLEETLKVLPASDYNVLSQVGAKLNRKVGIDAVMPFTCKACNNSVNLPFRYTSEFFRPSID